MINVWNKHQSKQIKVIPYIVTTAVIFINRVHLCVRCIDVMKQLIKGCNLKGNTNSSPWTTLALQETLSLVAWKCIDYLFIWGIIIILTDYNNIDYLLLKNVILFGNSYSLRSIHNIRLRLCVCVRIADFRYSIS